MTGLETGLGLMTAIGTVAGGYIGLKLRPLEKADEDNEKAINGLKTDIEKHLGELNSDVKEQKKEFERRLLEIEKSYLSRADLTAAIKEMRDHMDKGVDRVEAVVKALGVKVDHLAERVGKVEGATE